MNKLVMLVSILRRNLSETAVSFLNENGISVTLGRYGRGTATKEIFKMFMPDREKCVLFSIMPYKISKRIMQDLLDVCEHVVILFLEILKEYLGLLFIVRKNILSSCGSLRKIF